MTAALMLLFACAPLLANAQPQRPPSIDIPEITGTIAIENARIIQAPDRVIDRGTVLVRDGVIVSVGPNVRIPADARRIAGDSLFVYAGFIDALSMAAVPRPRQEGQPERVPNPGNPPDDRAGIQPQREVLGMLAPADPSVDQLRRLGFTTAHVVPHGQMLPGQGAIISLAGRDGRDMIVRNNVSLFAQFEGARGVYPGTPMGIMARFRQLHREAERRMRVENLFAAGQPMERPAFDPVHAAFYPVVNGTLPVFFRAPSALEVHRALSLREDLGLNLMIGALEEAQDVTDHLRRTGVPVALSLKLPDEPRGAARQRSAQAESTDEEPAYRPGLRTRSHADIEMERRNLEARQREVRREFYRNAARLEQAGVAFAFSTHDVRPDDIRKNVRKMIEHGLSPDAALAALTTNPASMFGLSRRHGTVEQGKAANLVVTTAPYFEEDAHVRYVFVDGRMFEYDRPASRTVDAARSANGSAPGASIVGRWNYTVSTPQGAVGGVIEFVDEGGHLSGTISSDMLPGEVLLSDIRLEGANLSFTFDGGSMGPLSFTGSISGDVLEGSIPVPQLGAMPVTGNRVPRP
jgi:imidazolonepropionase-like amidohydrolase